MPDWTADEDRHMAEATPAAISYVAGLLEGEGSFQYRHGSPRISIGMTDLDVIERCAAILGYRGKIYTRAARPRRKAQYVLQPCGQIAASWMMTLYPLLGRRRREQVRLALHHWRTTQHFQKRKMTCPQGHSYTHRFYATGAPHRVCQLCRTARQREVRATIRAAWPRARREASQTQAPCACGCGVDVLTPDSRGRARWFLHGHNARGVKRSVHAAA